MFYQAWYAFRTNVMDTIKILSALCDLQAGRGLDLYLSSTQKNDGLPTALPMINA